MKKSKEEILKLVSEDLLGGAAMSLLDLAMIEANEIKWSFIKVNNEYVETENLPS